MLLIFFFFTRENKNILNYFIFIVEIVIWKR